MQTLQLSDRPVRLTHADKTVAIPAAKVYFSFASGRLAYDCVECQAKCCKGHSYHSNVHELKIQLGLRPELRFFVDPVSTAKNPLWTVRNCAPACFFLNEHSQCNLHLDHGYRAKPETCRLFPFNSFLLVDGYLLVSPHISMCPLEVVPHGMVSHASEHQALLASLSDFGIEGYVPVGETIRGETNAIINREKQIRDLSETFGHASSYEPFAVAQRSLNAKDSEGSPKEQAECTVWSILGVPTIADDASVAHSVIALTPLLRSYFLFRPIDTAGGKRIEVDEERLPDFLNALYVIVLLAKAAGLRTVTYQSVLQLFRDSRALLVLLAYADCAVEWRAAAEIDLTFQGTTDERRRFIRIAKALLPKQQRRCRASLGQLLCDHSPKDDVVRALFLRRVAARLVGRLCRVDQEQTKYERQPLRTFAQRWALGFMSEDLVIEAFANR